MGDIIFLGAFFCVAITVIVTLGLAIYRTKQKLKCMCFAYKKYENSPCFGQLKCVDKTWDGHEEQFIYACENHYTFIHP